MGGFTLNVTAIGQYLTDIPTLEVWNDGNLENSSLISLTGTQMSLSFLTF